MKRFAKPGAGRPSKGDRVIMTVRLPRALSDAVRQRAEDEDLSYSEEIANAVAAAFNHPPVALPAEQAQQMKLSA